ncbi:MAG: putative lipid II flippase FtsW [Patescibacteria group bacterium]
MRDKKNLWGLLKNIFKKKNDGQVDWHLIGAIWILVIFGLIMLASAGVAVGWQKFGDIYWHLKHQLVFGLLPGLVLFIILSKIDYHYWKKIAAPLLFISIGLLVLVFIPGIGAKWGTSHSWINIFGLSVQPSEIVKLTFLLYLSAWLSSKQEHHIKDLSYGFIPFVFILGVIAVLNILEPDTGTMIIITAMSLLVYFVAGGSLWHLTWLSLFGAGGLALVVKLSPYRAARLTTFLHPELDPKGIGYHINQALLAVGSGGFFGRGYGHSLQKFAYLPEVTGDSIFAVVSEELGFVLTAIVVIIFGYIAIRGMKLANRCQDQFGKLLVVGIIVWFLVQAFFNIGAVIGILPLTGVPLPFISYGGTALMMCLAATGILANISKQVNNR